MSNLTKLLMLLCIGLLLAAASVWFIGGKKKEYDVTKTIKARPYQLFPYLVEPELKKKWVSNLVDESLVAGLEDIEAGTDPILKVGAELLTVLDIDGDRVELNGEVIRYQEKSLVSSKSRNKDMSMTSFFRLTGKDDETELEYRKVISFRGVTRFMSVFDEDQNQQMLEKEIDRLVALVEGETDSSIPDPDAGKDTVGDEDSAQSDAEKMKSLQNLFDPRSQIREIEANENPPQENDGG